MMSTRAPLRRAGAAPALEAVGGVGAPSGTITRHEHVGQLTLVPAPLGSMTRLVPHSGQTNSMSRMLICCF
jgi:hypothetical protein